MNNSEIIVLVGGITLIGGIWYYFFGDKKERKSATVEDGVQRIIVVVDAAYIPDRVVVKKGLPVEMVFDRRDSGSCTEEVIFDKLPTIEKKQISAKLPEGKQTKINFTPTQIGEYQFVCGMGMVHGKLIVE